MPNGNDRNWIRVRAALEGFFVKHGHWPTRVRLHPDTLEDLKSHLFTPASWTRVTEQLEFLADESAPIVAEDAAGRSYSYGEGFPDRRPSRSAEEWLGAAPDTPDAHG
jgi:hypothetical protein